MLVCAVRVVMRMMMVVGVAVLVRVFVRMRHAIMCVGMACPIFCTKWNISVTPR